MSATDTTYLRDLSHYDSDTALAGYAGATHKITEGTGYVDPKYASRMNAWRPSMQGKVLGSYHVLHTNDPAGQLDFWIRQQDKLTPWWRDWPHWIMQIDAEKWPTDGLTASTVVHFAEMLKAANLPGLQVCYASRGQFGDTLTGIPLDLWNAAYRSSTYPGNDSSAWAPYSGRTPVFWQYTSNPYDKNAYRGSVADLLAYIEGGESMALDSSDKTYLDAKFAAITAFDKPQPDGTPTSKIGRNTLTQGIPDGTAPAAPDGSYPRAEAWEVLTNLGVQVTALRSMVEVLSDGPVITQAQLDLAVLNALKTLAGGQA